MSEVGVGGKEMLLLVFLESRLVSNKGTEELDPTEERLSVETIRSGPTYIGAGLFNFLVLETRRFTASTG